MLRLLCVFSLLSATSYAEEWSELLDEDLSGWEVFTGVPHKTVEVPGWDEPATSENCQGGKPIGLGDPLGIYSVRIEEEEPILHVTGQVYAGLTSLEEYGDYHLSLEYRWLEKKWPPRLQVKRDSGLLLHCVGEHGAFWNVWMRCLECQIQEGDTGDFIPLAGSKADVPLERSTQGNTNRPLFDPQAPIHSGAGYTTHGPSTEAPHGEWNRVEVFTIGDRMAFVVNGEVNMALFNTRQSAKGGDKPLTRGKLQIQSEAAEIEYRRIRLRSITQFPESLRDLMAREN